MRMKKPAALLTITAVTAWFLFNACAKEQADISNLPLYYKSIIGRWSVINQGQFNSTDSTRDTIAGTDADFMQFMDNDTLISNTLLFGADTSPFTILNVTRFMVRADTMYNSSLTTGLLNFYIQKPLTDTSYTEYWVNLQKEE